jgi:elongation factor G
MPRVYPIEKVRDIGIIAHIDAGKTTITEGILYLTGRTHKIGAVHEGDTQMDWMEQERERGITITAAATTCVWTAKQYKQEGEHRINIIDTPGHIDFTVEVQRSLRVLDGAVVIFDGKMGVEPQSETVWHQADTFNVPRMCFINKINQTGGDFFKSLNSVRERLSPKACPIQLPIGFEKSISGIVDLVKMKSYTYKEFADKELIEGEVPENMQEEAEKYRKELIELAVESDDKLMEKYLEEGTITEEELIKAIRKSTLSGDMFPVMGGDGRGVIVETLLDAVLNYLPSPRDLPPVSGLNPKNHKDETRSPDDDAPASALAFKIATDPFVGTLTFFRLYSGTIKKGSYILNTTKNKTERVGRMVQLHANHREDIDEICAGDIGAMVGLKDTITGDSLSDPENPIILESIDFPDPVISVGIEPASKGDQEKMSIALKKLSEEDPTFRVKNDPETAETIISGMGELHLEILVDRMKREFSVDAKVGRPQVAYKETIKETAKAEGKYIKQSGGRGQYGHVWLELEPMERGGGFEFINKIKGGVIPQEFIPAVEKGVKEALDKGVVAGYPFVDTKVTLYDGSYHDVDSSEIAFKISAVMAFQNAAKIAKAILLEPIMKVDIIAPPDFIGDVTGDVSSKRGKILEMGDRGIVRTVHSHIPLSEMFGYSTTIRSMTQGRGSFTMEFSHYSEVPSSVAEGIVEGRGRSSGKK